MSRDLFYFSKGDRRAVIFLLAVIIAANAFRYVLSGHESVPETVHEELAMADTVREIVRDTATVRTMGRTAERRNTDSRGLGGTRNTASERNYRSRNYSDTLYIIRSELHDDTLQALPDRWIRKVRPTEPVDLNSADTAALKLLPGIGSYYASRIVDYRERLGGYIRPEQILEIDVLPDSLVQWFTVADTVPYRRIKVNSDALSVMRNHPYMNFYQARAITDLRKSVGVIKSAARLTLIEEFTGQDLIRLAPYLDFNQ